MLLQRQRCHVQQCWILCTSPVNLSHSTVSLAERFSLHPLWEFNIIVSCLHQNGRIVEELHIIKFECDLQHNGVGCTIEVSFLEFLFSPCCRGEELNSGVSPPLCSRPVPCLWLWCPAVPRWPRPGPPLCGPTWRLRVKRR